MSRSKCFENICNIISHESILLRFQNNDDRELLKPGTFVRLNNRDGRSGKMKMEVFVTPVIGNLQNIDEIKPIELNLKTKQDAERCFNLTLSNDYIAMVEYYTQDNVVSVLIGYGFKSIDNGGDTIIGVAENSKLIAKNIRDKFTFTRFGEDCFLIAKSVNRNEKTGERCFWLTDGVSGYKVVLGQRTEFVLVPNPENMTDNVFAVIEKISAEELEEMNVHFELRIGKIIIRDIRNTAPIKEFQVSYFNDNYDNFFERWRKYGQAELDEAKEDQTRIGFLRYTDLQRKSDGSVSVNIQNTEYTNDFINGMKEYGLCNEGTYRIRMKPDNDEEGRYILSGELQIRDGYAVIDTEKDYESYYANSGYIQADITGTEKSFERREKAFERIAKKKSGMPELAELMRGNRDYPGAERNPLWEPDEAVMNIFGSAPNASQFKALKMAINTPDIAIVQGPPGTGKSTVIRAIMTALSEENTNKNLSYASNLLTAYQRDATSNLAEKLLVFGLPVPVYAGVRDSENTKNYDKTLEEWVDSKKKHFLKNNPQFAAKAKSLQNREILKKIREMIREYDLATCSREQNGVILHFLRSKKVQDVLNQKERTEVENLWAEMSVDSKSIRAFRSLISALPQSQTSMNDDGKKTAANIIKILREKPLFPKKTKEIAGILDKLYQGENPNFKQIRYGIDLMLAELNLQSVYLVDGRFNEKVLELLNEAADSLEARDVTDEDMILMDYFSALNENGDLVHDDLSSCCTIIAATHQKSVASEVVSRKTKQKRRKNFTDDDFDLVYDNVLIDEAARSTPPDLLIPMSCATERIILVGDHNQLPQFVNNEVAIRAAGGDENSAEINLLKESLFKTLIENAAKLTEKDHIERFIRLDIQYRMPETLGNFVSNQFYEGKLRYGGGNHEQNLPVIAGLHMGWVSVGIENGPEESLNPSYRRPAEVTKIVSLLKQMTKTDEGKKYTYGVITFYTKQLELLNKAVSEAKEEGALDENTKIECGTVDSMQGKEFDIVFLSMVRSRSKTKNAVWNPYGFVANLNRQCVALSRAKKCMLVAGDPDMMEIQTKESRIKPLKDFYMICKKGGAHVGIIQ